MKIAILGYSGSGKSTLARAIAKKTGFACLHLDSVHFLPGWVEKADEQARTEVQAFLTAHADWVIDGNYPALCRAERLAAADAILFVALPRVSCLVRVLRRTRTHRGRVRRTWRPGARKGWTPPFVVGAVQGPQRRGAPPQPGGACALCGQGRAPFLAAGDRPLSCGISRVASHHLFPARRGRRGIPA